jgi:hypothetical protein
MDRSFLRPALSCQRLPMFSNHSSALHIMAGWQHYLQRELAMYLGTKTRKRLI